MLRMFVAVASGAADAASSVTAQPAQQMVDEKADQVDMQKLASAFCSVAGRAIKINGKPIHEVAARITNTISDEAVLVTVPLVAIDGMVVDAHELAAGLRTEQDVNNCLFKCLELRVRSSADETGVRKIFTDLCVLVSVARAVRRSGKAAREKEQARKRVVRSEGGDLTALFSRAQALRNWSSGIDRTGSGSLAMDILCSCGFFVEHRDFAPAHQRLEQALSVWHPMLRSVQFSPLAGADSIDSKRIARPHSVRDEGGSDDDEQEDQKDMCDDDESPDVAAVGSNRIAVGFDVMASPARQPDWVSPCICLASKPLLDRTREAGIVVVPLDIKSITPVPGVSLLYCISDSTWRCIVETL